VQANVVSAYRAPGDYLPEVGAGLNDDPSRWRLTGVSLLEADPLLRARYYLDGLAAQFQVRDAQTVQYNGIRAIELDGAVYQVSWEVGPGGAETTAGRNTEHDIWVEPYPRRRRVEMLAAAELWVQPRPQRVPHLYAGEPGEAAAAVGSGPSNAYG